MTEVQTKVRRKKSRKVKILVIAAIVVALAAVIVIPRIIAGRTVNKSISTAVVSRGSVVNTIEGSGTIAAIDQYEITSLVQGEILEDYFQEGDYISKGDLMYKIDASDLNNNLEKANIELEKSQMQYNDTLSNAGNLTITAPISGVVTSVKVKNGDNIQSNTPVATIIDKGNMLLKIDFITDEARGISPGQSATVSLENSFTRLPGQVTSVGSGSVLNSYGVEVTPVEISVGNPGGIAPGDKATAVVGDYACNSAGVFEYFKEKTVTSKAGGEVYGLSCNAGDTVKAGDVLLRLDDSNVESTLRNSQLSVKNSQLNIQNYYDQMDNYNITAPISGKVIQKNIKAGEKTQSGSSAQGTSSAMAIIADLSALVFDMKVDELDIASIEVGQPVDITADAFPNRSFTGVVDNVSIVGTSENGVTTYPVKVVVNEGEGSGLIPGLNVTAKIVVEQADDVLRVPVSAVQRGNVVLVKDESASSKTEDYPEDKGRFLKQLTVPEGFRPVFVEVGLSDSEFIEIKTGLSEGQTIWIPEIQMSSGNPITDAMNAERGGAQQGGMQQGGAQQGGMQRSGPPSREGGMSSGGGNVRIGG